MLKPRKMYLFTVKKCITGLRLKRIVASSFLLFACSAAFADSINCPCKVIKVTDGDTIHVLDQSRARHEIRLQGIDAPEKGQAYGNKSSKNLAGYIAGQHVEVEFDKRDSRSHVG